MQGPPPPPPPGGASPPPNRFVRKQHASPSPSSSPANYSLDATHRPPPSHSLGDSNDHGGKDVPYSSPSPPAGRSRRNSSLSYEGGAGAQHHTALAHLSFTDGTPSQSQSARNKSNVTNNEEFSTRSPPSSSSVGRKLRALRRAGGFSELASVPERLQQWFDGCYSPRYQPTSTSSLVAQQQHHHQHDEFDPAMRAASLALHASLASFSVRHCFDSPLFDAVSDSASREQQDNQLSTVSGSSSGVGVDHGAKALFDKWTSTFEECLTDFVSSILKLTDEEFAATLEIDKKEEEGSGAVSFLAASGTASYSATPPSLTSYAGGVSPRRPMSQSGAALSSNFDFRTAIAPLAAALSANLSVALSNRAGNIVNNGGSNNKLGGGTPQHRPAPSHHQPFGAPPPLPLDSGLLSSVNPSHQNQHINNNHVAQLEQEEQQQQRSEKEHFYRWSEAIEFPAFVAQLRGTRALLAKIFGGSTGGEVVGLSHETLNAVRSFVQKEGENAVRLLGNAQEIADPSARATAHKLSKSLAKEFFSHQATTTESGKKEELSFFLLTPLSHFVRDASASARQAHRRRAALIPLMALWCPLGMDEDIWPTIQSLLSASGAPLSIHHASSSGDTAPPLTLKITLDKKRLKELTLFRIRLSAAGRKAALMASSLSAADSHISAGASPAVLSSPQYLLRPTASAAGSVAIAVEKTAADSALSAVTSDDSTLTTEGTATTAAAGAITNKGSSSSNSGALDASEDLERDWTRFISVFAEGLDSATFDKFVSYMYNVVLPQVVARDSRELVRLAFGGSNAGGGGAVGSNINSGNSSGTNLAAAFCASISSPLASTTGGLANTKGGSASSSTTSHLPPAGSVQSAINAAARTVKRVFWLAFQQLDTLRRDAIPLGLVLDLISAAAEEIIVAAKNSGVAGSSGGGATGLAEIVSGAEARLQEDNINRRIANQNDPITSSCDAFSYGGEVGLFPPQLAVDLSTISCTSAARLASYFKFTDRDRAKLLIRIRNEQKALEREANLQGLLKDVTRRDDATTSASLNNAKSIGGGGGSQASTNLTPSTTTSTSLLSASTTTGGGVEETLPVSLYRFVHIIKDLVFDPLYSAAHPPAGTTPSPSASSLSSLSFGDRSGSRHMYWSELVAFVEVLMVISNLPRFSQRLKKRS